MVNRKFNSFWHNHGIWDTRVWDSKDLIISDYWYSDKNTLFYLNNKTIFLAIQIYEGSEHCRNKYITNISSFLYVKKLSDTDSSAMIRWINLWLHVYVSTFMNTLDLRKKIFSKDLNWCRLFYWKKICWFFFYSVIHIQMQQACRIDPWFCDEGDVCG